MNIKDNKSVTVEAKEVMMDLSKLREYIKLNNVQE